VNSDGNAFLVDQAHAAAAMSTKWFLEGPIRKVQKFRGWLKDENGPAMRQMRDRIPTAKTHSEQRLASRELWKARQINRRNPKKLQQAEEARDFTRPGG